MDNFDISTDKSLLDIEKIHLAVKNSYWASSRTLQQTQTGIANCVCYGVYNENSEQVGFARVLTDEVVFAYIMDVMIFEGFKGYGLGKKLINHILKDQRLKNVSTIALKTKDAHSLYEKYGFKRIGNSELWMAIDKMKLE